jgi:uncharacterized repeat protein (TIGR01451 family)
VNPRRLGVVLAGAIIGSLLSATPAGAAPTLQATAPQVAAAVAADAAAVTGASYVSPETTLSPRARAVWDAGLTSFPTNGTTFGVLSSGDAENVDEPGTFTSVSNGGGNVRGNSDLDVTIMKVDLSVPTGRNCLSFDFQFLSEEYPNFVGESVNDAFVAELDTSTWTTQSSAISAPNNFAFGPDGNVISINSTGIAGMTAANGTGTAFDGGTSHGGATQLLRASTPITPGAHSVYLSTFDQGDQIYDSVVFLDNLFLGTAPEGQCQPGAQLPPPSIAKTADESSTVQGGTNGYTITVSNPNDEAVSVDALTDVLPSGFTYVPGSTTGAVTADPDQEGNTLTWQALEGSLFTVPANGQASVSFDVVVSDTPGDYFNEASADAGQDTATTGPTAPVTVAPPPVLSPCDPVTLDGTAAGEKLVGTAGADRVRGLGGRDVLDGLEGDDQLCGGLAGDYLYGRAGVDILRGENGNDRLYGSRHGDTVEGGAGHDALIAGRGPDTILAVDGTRDCILTGKGEDVVAGDPVDRVDPKGGCPAGFWL